MTKRAWFEVDAKGLREQLEGRRGVAALLLELLQNALDEDVTKIEMTLAATSGKPEATFSVEDDSPTGFRDLADAFTLFAPSYKKGVATKRGRFNVGEKLVLALCEEAVITSTKGTVVFDKEGRRQLNAIREKGTKVVCRLRMTHADTAELDRLIKTVILPPDCQVEVTYNDTPLLARKPVAVLSDSLPTELAGEDGVIRKTTRKTQVYLYDPLPGESPTIYEMGLPVVEVEGKWHVDVQQKVPLNLERDNVPPSYLRALRVLTANALYSKLGEKDFTASWFTDAVESPAIEPAAVQSYLDAKYGKDRVAADPRDPEATRRAQAAGYSVIYGRSEPSNVWTKAREGGFIPSAGVSFGTKIEKLDNALPEEKWTPGIKNIAAYAKALAERLLPVKMKVEIVNDPGSGILACYGPHEVRVNSTTDPTLRSWATLTFNVGRLGYKWFDHGVSVEVNDLLLHEFGHQAAPDHLSSAYHDALTRLGAEMVRLALEQPEFFQAFAAKAVAA